MAALQVVYGARCVEKLGLGSMCASEEGSAAETRAVPSLQLSVRSYSCACVQSQEMKARKSCSICCDLFLSGRKPAVKHKA